MTLAIGDAVPAATLLDADGATIDLAAMKGAPLVVYFYPKADTPGCTTEAQDFTRLAPEFAHLNAQVLAVSRDAPAKLCKFRDKYGLTVCLRRRWRGVRGVRHLGRKAELRPHLYGDRTLDLPLRRRRQVREGMAQGPR